jgi:deoxyadenosine/deoxycytidine kinase
MDKYFITIAGNIGVGKSTLVRMLSQRHGWEPVFEAVEENPYLADFYQDMPRWSFQSQVFFLSRRLRQHNGLLKYKKSVIQDRSVYEDAEIFARNLYDQGNMGNRDWACYFDLYRTLAAMLPAPDLVIYLKADMPTLRRRIAMRGREYEQDIDEKYLARLNVLYDRWADGFRLCPVLTVDTNNLNFVQNDEHLDQIWQKIVDRLQGKDYLTLE